MDPSQTLNAFQMFRPVYSLVSPTFRDTDGQEYKPREIQIPSLVLNWQLNGLTTRSNARCLATTTERDYFVGISWNDAKQGIRQGYPDEEPARRWSVQSYTCPPDNINEWNTEAIVTNLDRDHAIYQRSYTLETNPNPSEIIYESEYASLTVSALLNICKPGFPGWFTDLMVDASFEILSHVTRCEQNSVSLLSVAMASELYRNGIRIKQDLETESYDAHIKRKVLGKDFILIPISDGYKQSLEFGSVQAKGGASSMPEVSFVGSHWTLLVVDCRDLEKLTCYYFDQVVSIHPTRTVNFKVARMVEKALRDLSSLDKPSAFIIAANAPHHTRRENRSELKDKGSACGPYIWEMSRQICQYIADCYDEGVFDIDIGIPQGFCQQRQWDSIETRERIQRLIMRELRTRILLNDRIQWMDDRTPCQPVQPGWESWLKREGKSSHYFWDPMTPGVPKSG